MLRVPVTSSNSVEWTRQSATSLNQAIRHLITAQSDIAGFKAAGALIPITYTADFTVGSERDIICNGTAAITAILPDPTTSAGRMLTIKTVAAFTVASASSNVVPLAGGAAGTAILAATAGKWARLVSDGVNWITMEAA